MNDLTFPSTGARVNEAAPRTSRTGHGWLPCASLVLVGVLVPVLGLVTVFRIEGGVAQAQTGSAASAPKPPPPRRAAVPAALESHLGRPFVLEIPTLEDLGTSFPKVPAGWTVVQANAGNVEELQRYLRVGGPPALGLFDEHGNCLVVDRSFQRSRWGSRLSEYQRRRSRLEDDLAEHWKEFERLRSRGLRRELEVLFELIEANSAIDRTLVGYSAIERARVRLAEHDTAIRNEFFAAMAAEGMVTARVLARRLEELQERADRLPVAKEIARRRAWIERGLVVERRRRGS